MAHQPGDDLTETSLKENLKAPSTWLRLLFMILFLALWSMSRIVVLTVVVLQFFWVLIGGKTNARLAVSQFLPRHPVPEKETQSWPNA